MYLHHPSMSGTIHSLNLNLLSDHPAPAAKPKPASFGRAARWVLGLFAAVVLLCCALVVGVWAGLGQSPRIVLHDPSVQFGFPLYAGAVSTVGIWCLVGAATVSGFASLFSSVPRSTLMGAAVLCAAMAVDDAFMIHEGILRDRLGLPELLLPLAYAALALWVLARLRGFAQQIVPGLLTLGLGLLAGSVSLDTLGTASLALSVAEDLLKLLGFAAISSSFTLFSYALLTGARGR